ncbi:MAG: YbaB/EbfC family nucleoid-associated protein [Planctomycetota bacterium]|nr:YbaB/EbfC family nucleoid-associated protein [Planctomycetota bacterium]
MTQEFPLLKQAQELQRLLRELQKDLADREVEGVSGGSVRCVVTGDLEVRSVRIDPSLLASENASSVSAHVTAAVRDAVRAAADLKRRETEKVTGGILTDLGI